MNQQEFEKAKKQCFPILSISLLLTIHNTTALVVVSRKQVRKGGAVQEDTSPQPTYRLNKKDR